MSSTEFFSTYFLPFSYSIMFPCEKVCFLLYLRNLYTKEHLNEIDGKACVSPCQMVTLHAIAQTKLKYFVSNFLSTIEVVGDVSHCTSFPSIFPQQIGVPLPKKVGVNFGKCLLVSIVNIYFMFNSNLLVITNGIISVKYGEHT